MATVHVRGQSPPSVRVAGEWTRLRVARRTSTDANGPAAPEILPAALGAAERGLGKIRERLAEQQRRNG